MCQVSTCLAVGGAHRADLSGAGSDHKHRRVDHSLHGVAGPRKSTARRAGLETGQQDVAGKGGNVSTECRCVKCSLV